MAYAAVLSLDRILEHLSNPRRLEQHQTPLQAQQIKSLQENLKCLLGFLDDSWPRRSEELQCLEREIRDAAYKIEDNVESHISKNFGKEGFQERQMRDQTFCVNFEKVAHEIDSIKTKAAKLKELWGSTDLHQSQSQSQRTSFPTGQSRLPSIGKNDMVGFGKDLTEIIERLRNPPALQTIPVTGMGGIGKTTLARNVYDHPWIALRFDTRAWVSISQEYREREVLLSLLDSTKQLNAEMHQEKSTEDLKEDLYKSLKGRRYLVVMDDVWTTEAWDSLCRIFPDDRNGSRIMLTTRLSSVVDSNSSPHHMQFLNKTDSWDLLRREVFGKDCCPLELEEVGKEIAENCKGLPLSLVVIGGHLSKANKTKDHWEDVAENVKAVVNAEDANCSGILSLSYDHLPHYLKPCFLYMGVFPEDDEIRVSKLIKFWVAEGFLKPVGDKTLEKVAEEYLGDLISRNLIMSSKKSSRGKIKTCSIHDMLRDLCLKKAHEEKFFHFRDKDDIFPESIKYSRRLCIHPDILHEEFKGYQSMGSLPAVRSILIQKGFPEQLDESQINELVDGKLFPLLRVLDLKQSVDGFPFVKLVHSRYLAFASRSRKITIPKTLPDFLRYLQTLIVNGEDVHLPEEIWRMTQLRHLMFRRCYLPSPIAGENFVLGNLLTLSKVSSSSCTKKVFQRVPNLNKLGISYDYLGDEISLGTLVNLPQLETLKIIGRAVVPINFTFPPNIKKLTFSSSYISWKHMTTVGSMPNLVVLKLLDNAFVGQKWEPTEGEFCKLKFLLLSNMNLVQWRPDGTHFPCLESLIIRQCFKLEELPCSIGDSTLQIIELDDASPSAVTWAKQIQEEQVDLGNDSLRVHVNYRFQHYRLPLKELAERIRSNDDTLLLQAIKEFRESFLSVYLQDPMREALSGVVPRLLELLNRDGYPQLQREAALAISTFSLCSSARINILMDHGAIPILLRLLRSPDDDLCEQALRLLGRFASYSTKSCDLIISYGGLMPLLAQFNDTTKLTIMRAATNTLSCLFGGVQEPQFEQVKPALLPLSRLIHTDDGQVLKSACRAIVALAYGTEDGRLAVIDAGVFPRLIELLLHPSVSNAALYAVASSIPNVDDIQIQVIIDKGALLPCLLNFLTRKGYFSKDSTCQIISEIIRRSKDNLQAVIEAGIISPVLQMFQDAHDFHAAAEVIYNATTKGTNEQIKLLVHEGCIEPMCDLLVNPYKVHVIKICLEGLENILKVGEAEKNQGNTDDLNVFAQMIDDACGLQKIKNLKTHDDSRVCEMAVRILETYWPEEGDE